MFPKFRQTSPKGMISQWNILWRKLRIVSTKLREIQYIVVPMLNLASFRKTQGQTNKISYTYFVDTQRYQQLYDFANEPKAK